MKKLKLLLFHFFSILDQYLKFPQLKKGEVGIQIGFDMLSYITSDLFEMARKVGETGLVLGIDPDNWNHKVAKEIINRKKYSQVRLVELGTFSKKVKASFLFGKKSSWNQVGIIPIDETVEFTGEEKEVQLDTLDNILEQNNIDVKKVGHVNITNNGAEYFTLLGFERGLREAENIALTVIAGRYDSSGTIDGRPDYEMIIDFLKSRGYKTKFRRIHQLFWWGFCVKLFINRRYIYNQKNYGVIFASKGKKRIPFYQSFS